MKMYAVQILLALLWAALPADAQTPADGVPRSLSGNAGQDAYTPERINSEIEEAAKKLQAASSNPVARGLFFKIAYAENTTEFASLARYSVMLLTAISRDSKELPIRRVFIRANGRDVSLQTAATWISGVEKATSAGNVYGTTREDGYYLIPTGMLVRDGEMLIDFFANANNIPLQKLPNATAVAATRSLANLDPAPNSRPDPMALRAIIIHKFPYFVIPR